MNYREYAITQKAVELYREKLQEDVLKAIKKQNLVGGIHWRVFRKYSITGYGETTSIDTLSEKELFNQILMSGVTEKELESYLTKASELWDEWKSQDKHRKQKT